MTNTLERSRILFLMTTALVIYGGLTARMFYLQVIKAPTLKEAAERQSKGIKELQAKRGMILDANGRVLATNSNIYTVGVDKNKAKDDEGDWRQSLEQLCQLLNIDESEKQKHLHALSNEELIDRTIANHLSESDKEWIKSHNLPGVHLKPSESRVYPEKHLAATIIGFTGKDNTGLSGIERAFNESLQGQEVNLIVDKAGIPDKMTRGVIIADRDFTKEVSNHGNDVVLTIDAYIQYVVERELKTAYQEFDASYVNAVVIDTKTSEILAMAEYPSFDPNKYEEYPKEHRYPRILTHSYEPGSVMKPFTLIAALEQKVITPHAPKIYCEEGNYRIHRKTIRDDIHSFADLTPHEILVYSSNIGTVKIAMRMGEDESDFSGQLKILKDTYERFGFNPDENTTVIPEQKGGLPTNWLPHLMSSVPFGQAMKTNSLVLAGAYNAIANHGVYRKPQLIKGQRRSDGVFIPNPYERPVRVTERLIAEDVARMMIDVTEDPEGTGRRVRIPGFYVAGKTGTAQKAMPGQGYVGGLRIATFAGFFPAQEPEITIVVMVDEPKHKKYGGEVAGPAWKRIAEEIIAYKGIAPTRKNDPLLIKQQKEHSASIAQGGNSTHPFGKMKRLPMLSETERKYEDGYMPNLIGLSKREAYILLAGYGLTASFEGHGKIISQEIAPGNALLEKTHVGMLACETALSDPSVESVSDLVARR